MDALLETERIRPLRRSEYDHLVELGAFEDERVELLYGRIVEISPRSEQHVRAVSELAEWLIAALGKRARVRIQAPLAASDDHEPEPDVAVVDRDTGLDDHPTTAHLVVEVCDSSRRRDMVVKSAVYAAMGVADYWVLDVARRELVVHRDPAADGYRQVTTQGDDATVALLRFADVSTRVVDLLPPRR